MIAILFLFDNNINTKSYNSSLFLKILIVFLSSIFMILTHTSAKILSFFENIAFSFTIVLLTQFILSLIVGFKEVSQIKSFSKQIIGISILLGLLNFIYHMFLFNAYFLGSLGISYKIMSFSPFIAIILSYIFYKEKISIRQYIGIFLAIISIILFI